MASLSKALKESRIGEFVEITGASVPEATKFLKGCNYRLESALDAFYSDSTAMTLAETQRENGKGGQSAKKLNKLWDRYKDAKNPEESDIDGTIRYCEDLGVSPEDVIMLVLAWFTKAPTMGRFRRETWVEAWREVKIDSLELQREYVPRLQSQMKEGEVFRKVYNFTFEYARTEGQKSMQLETAHELWKLLIPLDPNSTFSVLHLEWWLTFLETRGSKAVSKDTWNLFLEFTRTIDAGFAQHDEEAAWPSLIDDFVDFARLQSES